MEQEQNIYDPTSYKTNFNDCVNALIEVFIQEFGELHRDIITKRMNGVNVIDYVLPKHISKYLTSIGIDTCAYDQEQKNIEESISNIRKRKIFFEIYKNNPKSNILEEENQKAINDNNYISPFCNFPVGDLIINDSFSLSLYKQSIIERLGLAIPHRYSSFITKPNPKEEYTKAINSEWEKCIGDNIDLKIIYEANKKYPNKDTYEFLSSYQGAVNAVKKYEALDLLWSKGFDIDKLSQNYRQIYAQPNINKNSKKESPVIIIPTLYSENNDDHLLKFIHELVHAISCEIIEYSEDKIEMKFGLDHGVENLITHEQDIHLELNMLNEITTQYSASNITENILAIGLEKKLFNFQLPQQTSNLFQSYPKPLEAGIDFLESNKNLLYDAMLTQQCIRQLFDTYGKENVENISTQLQEVYENKQDSKAVKENINMLTGKNITSTTR